MSLLPAARAGDSTAFTVLFSLTFTSTVLAFDSIETIAALFGRLFSRGENEISRLIKRQSMPRLCRLPERNHLDETGLPSAPQKPPFFFPRRSPAKLDPTSLYQSQTRPMGLIAQPDIG